MSPHQLHRFIGGRRAYNRRRQDLAIWRRLRVVQMLAAVDVGQRGWKAEIARELGVHRTTIGRDLRWITSYVVSPSRVDHEVDAIEHDCRFLLMMEDGDLRHQLALWQAEVRRAAQ
jgi:hypothetical protein